MDRVLTSFGHDALNFLYKGKYAVDEAAQESNKIDHQRVEQMQSYLQHHAQALALTISVATTFFLSPHILVVGTVLGMGLKGYFFDNRWVQMLDPQDKILSHTEVAMAVTGAVSSILSLANGPSYYNILPALTGLALGSTIIDGYVRVKNLNGQKDIATQP